MGVPAFFRWLSERYPKMMANCVEEWPEMVGDTEVPVDTTAPNPNGVEFHNLYLDMNGIIHPCFHPEDRPPPTTEAEVFHAMFDYIDRIMALVRPRRLVYMAIDGVAPRAKMNQQRSRRFRAAADRAEAAAIEAKLREDWRRQGVADLPVLSKQEAGDGAGGAAEGAGAGAGKAGDDGGDEFDSNVITPGTPFMERLAWALQWYVHKRLNEEPGWRGLAVVLSDSNTPGEGEHKFMQFIREQRGRPGWDANTRHCVYGLDADLIHLALASHEPHFYILREVVFPPRRGGRGSAPQSMTGPQAGVGGKPDVARKPYQFLKVGVLREYLVLEFSGLAESLPFAFEPERVIDDFVFMCFFVGNDFLPHMPTLDIREQGIELMMTTYREQLPRLGGYLVNGAQLHLDRVEAFAVAVGTYEDRIFAARMRKLRADARRRQEQNSGGADHRPPEARGPPHLRRGPPGPLHEPGAQLGAMRGSGRDPRQNGEMSENATAAAALKEKLLAATSRGVGGAAAGEEAAPDDGSGVKRAAPDGEDPEATDGAMKAARVEGAADVKSEDPAVAGGEGGTAAAVVADGGPGEQDGGVVAVAPGTGGMSGEGGGGGGEGVGAGEGQGQGSVAAPGRDDGLDAVESEAAAAADAAAPGPEGGTGTGETEPLPAQGGAGDAAAACSAAGGASADADGGADAEQVGHTGVGVLAPVPQTEGDAVASAAPLAGAGGVRGGGGVGGGGDGVAGSAAGVRGVPAVVGGARGVRGSGGSGSAEAGGGAVVKVEGGAGGDDESEASGIEEVLEAIEHTLPSAAPGAAEYKVALKSAVQATADKFEDMVAHEEGLRLGEEGWRARYYEQKFGVPPGEEQEALVGELRRAYAEGLAWVMRYYYDGVAAWRWFYPFHYAPFASDLKGIGGFEIAFELGEPFQPLNQLMGVLPAASKHALPAPLQPLFDDPASPILDFYPADFKTDMNGKRFAWQGVALLPFIDDSRLLAATGPVIAELHPDDKRRNEMRKAMILARRDTAIGGAAIALAAAAEPGCEAELEVEATGVAGQLIAAGGAACPEVFRAPPLAELGEDIEGNVVVMAQYEDPPHVAHEARLLDGTEPEPPCVSEHDLPPERPLWCMQHELRLAAQRGELRGGQRGGDRSAYLRPPTVHPGPASRMVGHALGGSGGMRGGGGPGGGGGGRGGGMRAGGGVSRHSSTGRGYANPYGPKRGAYTPQPQHAPAFAYPPRGPYSAPPAVYNAYAPAQAQRGGYGGVPPQAAMYAQHAYMAAGQTQQVYGADPYHAYAASSYDAGRAPQQVAAGYMAGQYQQYSPVGQYGGAAGGVPYQAYNPSQPAHPQPLTWQVPAQPVALGPAGAATAAQGQALQQQQQAAASAGGSFFDAMRAQQPQQGTWSAQHAAASDASYASHAWASQQQQQQQQQQQVPAQQVQAWGAASQQPAQPVAQAAWTSDNRFQPLMDQRHL